MDSRHKCAAVDACWAETVVPQAILVAGLVLHCPPAVWASGPLHLGIFVPLHRPLGVAVFEDVHLSGGSWFIHDAQEMIWVRWSGGWVWVPK